MTTATLSGYGELIEPATVRIERMLPGPIERVWDYLTDSDLRAQWLAELHPDSELNQRVSVFALFGMMNWIYTWYRVGRDVPVEELAENMCRLFLCGYLQSSVEVSAGPTHASPDDFRSSLWLGSIDL